MDRTHLFAVVTALWLAGVSAAQFPGMAPGRHDPFDPFARPHPALGGMPRWQHQPREQEEERRRQQQMLDAARAAAVHSARLPKFDPPARVRTSPVRPGGWWTGVGAAITGAIAAVFSSRRKHP